jgi:hypothetical protein
VELPAASTNSGVTESVIEPPAVDDDAANGTIGEICRVPPTVADPAPRASSGRTTSVSVPPAVAETGSNGRFTPDDGAVRARLPPAVALLADSASGAAVLMLSDPDADALEAASGRIGLSRSTPEAAEDPAASTSITGVTSARLVDAAADDAANASGSLRLTTVVALTDALLDANGSSGVTISVKEPDAAPLDAASGRLTGPVSVHGASICSLPFARPTSRTMLCVDIEPLLRVTRTAKRSPDANVPTLKLPLPVLTPVDWKSVPVQPAPDISTSVCTTPDEFNRTR